MRKVVLAALLTVLLALTCIGAVELAFCRIEEPQLYHAITDPVIDRLDDTRQQAAVWLTAAGNAVTDWSLRAADKAVTALHSAILNASNSVEYAASVLMARLKEIQRAGEPALPRQTPIADPIITELITIQGQEYLTGGNLKVPYYNQGDVQWAEQPYGTDLIGQYGCGPTVLAMAVSALTGQTVTPTDMASWAVENGYWASHSGSYLSVVSGAAEAFGLECTSLGIPDAESLCDRLAISQGLIVALVGPGHFTKNGHFIILRGMTLEGEVLVSDPNSRENSLTLWEPQLILDELSGSRTDGAPLWLLTASDQQNLTA